jgi:DNA-directed RNA polymerase I, II, and III subunit RPABC3
MAAITTTGDATLYEDQFVVSNVDQSKYDRVARIGAESVDSTVALTLDINTELYPLQLRDNFHLLLATTLQIDGSKEQKGWRDIGRGGPGGETTLADMYDYVCYGRVYKFDDDEKLGENLYVPHSSPHLSILTFCSKVFVSFGGLLLAITGSYKKLSALRVDDLYLLIKK